MKQRYKYYIVVPIVLASVTHLWNPSGFPSLHPDESDYIRKAMHVLAGLGPQEGTSDPIAINNQPYTHPHFGQLFLAAILAMVGYPNTLGPEPSAQSIESLYAVPRLLMGILAVVDTIIIYKIAERRYYRTVALVASSLFAVMPVTWILRQIYLDNILLPFLLSSILFAVYIKPSRKTTVVGVNQSRIWNINNQVLVLLSGILLGIAIYTKIPAFTMIPLVGYLIFMNSGKRVKNLAFWFIPVIAIPCLWPAYALSVGQFDLWIDGIIVQQNRLEAQHENKVFSSFKNIFKIDPVFLSLGAAGLIFASIKRDYWILVWVIPFLIFSYFIGWVIYFHLVPIFPAFCISAGKLMVGLFKSNVWRRLISPVLISAVLFFGLVASMLLITSNVNSHQYEAYAFVVDQLLKNDDKNDNKTKNSNIVLAGHRMYYWIPKYVFQASFDTFPRDSLPVAWNDSRIILIVSSKSCCCQCPYFSELYRGTKEIRSFSQIVDLPEHYPYTGLMSTPSIGKKVAVRVWSPG